MGNDKYSLSFTTGAALIQDSLNIARLYLEEGGWANVRVAVLRDNTLQSRTQSTLKKVYGEISRRLANLSDEEIQLLVDGDEIQKKQWVWLAICRQYQLIYDFAVEVLVSNYNRSQYLVSHDDYDAFYHPKAEWHSNLDKASSATQRKARQVIFKMLRECGLINEQNEIVIQRLSPQLHYLLKQKKAAELGIFPGVDY
jgi:hypothetical protein